MQNDRRVSENKIMIRWSGTNTKELAIIQLMRYQDNVRVKHSLMIYIFPKTDEKYDITTVDSIKNMWHKEAPLF